MAEADLDSWARTYDVNVLGTVRVTKALLPALRASGAGDVVFVGSTAGLVSYEGGASYTAAKHGVHTLAETLRLELNGEPVRVIEIAPGMVRTEEFSLNRLGSAEAADAVYRGVREPLVAEDVADCIAWTVTRPHHVNIDLMVVRPLAQAAQHKVAREGLSRMEIRPAARRHGLAAHLPDLRRDRGRRPDLRLSRGLSSDRGRPAALDGASRLAGPSWPSTGDRVLGSAQDGARTGPAVARTSPRRASWSTRRGSTAASGGRSGEHVVGWARERRLPRRSSSTPSSRPTQAAVLPVAVARLPHPRHGARRLRSPGARLRRPAS